MGSRRAWGLWHSCCLIDSNNVIDEMTIITKRKGRGAGGREAMAIGVRGKGLETLHRALYMLQYRRDTRGSENLIGR